jgi:fructosamine-3-kinase
MDARLARSLHASLGARVRSSRPLGGGDINQALRVELDDGRACFVKTHPDPPTGMFGAEAEGLQWLRVAGGPRIPQVLAVSDGDDGGPAWLALELIEPTAPARDHAESLGRQLAALHRAAPPGFGLARDNFIAVLPQPNRPLPDWPSFYGERRLGAQLERARERGRATRAMLDGFERLRSRLPELCGEPEPPARLHGDLWGGNAMTGPAGEPVLIDPAVYGGHREVDLAMMRLFGGFTPRTFDAYDEAYPLAPGHARRVELYQLYPLMVHVNLFGGGYAARVERILAQLT